MSADPTAGSTLDVSESETSSRLTVPTCPACGTILPEDATTGWSGECPSCHRVNSDDEVFY